jgi:uncharacterized membrane protein YqjE
MAVEDRSFSDVMQDIVHNVQEIVRSEVRLAKTEIGEEAAKAKSSAVLLGAGAVTAIFATFYLLFTIFQALALLMPPWAAALIVGAALAIVATLMLMAGVRRFKQIHPAPERTVETIKENVEWAKQQQAK